MGPIHANYAQQVADRGFSVVENVISAAQVSRLRSAVGDIRVGEAVRRKRNVYGVRNLLEVCPEARRAAASSEIRGFVSPILGERCFAVRAVFFDKVADANWGLGWHQDSVIAVRERREVEDFVAWSRKAGVWQVQPPAGVLAQMLAVRIHLDDCHLSNGPLRVLPGSHDHGWLDEEIDRWKERVSEVVCEVSAGGVVVMRPLLLHASAAAENPVHRRVIHIEFANADLPRGLDWHQRIGPGKS